ncbi:5-formyltetrahydrofolate cyclo-ligase, partial [Clostridium saudiense]|nr:5-formyltetrahydrofolate cyclo-ligase [Clostridium saudiense]
ALEYKVDKVALAYGFQVIDNIEAEKHDIKVDCVITNNEIIYI